MRITEKMTGINKYPDKIGYTSSLKNTKNSDKCGVRHLYVLALDGVDSSSCLELKDVSKFMQDVLKDVSEAFNVPVEVLFEEIKKKYAGRNLLNSQKRAFEGQNSVINLYEEALAALNHKNESDPVKPKNDTENNSITSLYRDFFIKSQDK